MPIRAGSRTQELLPGYVDQLDHLGVLAEYLVNNVETLPDNYSASQLWNRFRDQFVNAVRSPELADLERATEAAGQKLLDAVDRLAASLKATRSELSLKFDVPLVAEVVSGRE